MLKSTPSDQVIAELARFFARDGYVRLQNPKRLAREGWRRYKKGYEVRLTAQSDLELDRIRDLLCHAGFKPGRPFVKERHYCQPVYGRAEVDRFLTLVTKRE
ncbi:MAG: hypothetical protein HY360_26945 [Verrucomicrobia bacterium]|nr:hypothetical protein [Verrucomicrobiota bacterium]